MEVEKETLEAEKSEKYAKEGLTKAAAYVKTIREKQEILSTLEKSDAVLEEEYKQIK